MILYFNKLPELVCTFKDGVKKQCDWETACLSKNKNIIGYGPDLTKSDTFDNFVVRTNLICAPKKYIGYFGVSMTLGIAVGSIFLPYMADKFGRKTILLLSLALTIPVLAITVNA